MKLLTNDFFYRKWLMERNALEFEGELIEKLVGLTYVESVFYVEKTRDVNFNFNVSDTKDVERFLLLHERHEKAIKLGNDPATIRAR